MKKVLCVSFVFFLSIFGTGCFSSSSSDSATKYTISFDFAPATGSSSTVSISSTNIFTHTSGEYDAEYDATATSYVSFYFLDPSSIPATLTKNTTGFGFDYIDANGTDWTLGSETLSMTVTQLTPTIKGTFSGTVINGTTTATITNGTFEGSL